MWAHPSAAAAREEVEDITLIIGTHLMPFPYVCSMETGLMIPSSIGSSVRQYGLRDRPQMMTLRKANWRLLFGFVRWIGI